MIINGILTLGRDAELKSTQTGTMLLNFTGAYNVGWGDNKETMWLRCTLFGKNAQGLQPHLTKGAKIFINGKDLKINQYQKQDGTTGVSLECIVNDVEFAGGGQNAGQQQPQNQQGFSGGQNPQPNQLAGNFQKPMNGSNPQPNDFQDNDVPF